MCWQLFSKIQHDLKSPSLSLQTLLDDSPSSVPSPVPTSHLDPFWMVDLETSTSFYDLLEQSPQVLVRIQMS